MNRPFGGFFNGGGSTIPLGEVVHFPSTFPPVVEDSGMKFLSSGYYETTDYAPSLQFLADKTLGYDSTVFGTGGMGGYGWDTDGQGLWLIRIVGDGTGKVYRTTDNGLTFTNIASNLGSSDTADTAIKRLSGVGAASVWLTQGSYGTKRSTDGGITWTTIASSAAASNGWIANNGNTVLVRGGDTLTFRRSTDGGVTFGSNTTFGGTDPTVRWMVHAGGTKFAAVGSATFGGIAKPTIWISENDGVSFGTAQAIGVQTDIAAVSVIYSPLYQRLYVSVGSTSYSIKPFTTAAHTSVTTLTTQPSIRYWAAFDGLGEGVIIGTSDTLIYVKENSTDATPLTSVTGLAGSSTANTAVGYSNSTFTGMGPTSTFRFYRFYHAVGFEGPSNNALPNNVRQYMRIK